MDFPLHFDRLTLAMFRQIAAFTKPFTTSGEITLQWSLSRVGSFVHRHRRSLGEFLVTNLYSWLIREPD